MKPFSFTHETLERIPDASDQRILHRLGGVQRETWYRSPYESTARFTPNRRDLQELLPELSSTGRLFWRARESGEIHPVTWDGKEPWKFRVEVQAVGSGKQYEVSGAFCRGGSHIAVSMPEQLSREGIFILDDAVSFYEGMDDWISFFQEEGSFFFPESEADQWLETIDRSDDLVRNSVLPGEDIRKKIMGKVSLEFCIILQFH